MDFSGWACQLRGHRYLIRDTGHSAPGPQCLCSVPAPSHGARTRGHGLLTRDSWGVDAVCPPTLLRGALGTRSSPGRGLLSGPPCELVSVSPAGPHLPVVTSGKPQEVMARVTFFPQTGRWVQPWVRSCAPTPRPAAPRAWPRGPGQAASLLGVSVSRGSWGQGCSKWPLSAREPLQAEQDGAGNAFSFTANTH